MSPDIPHPPFAATFPIAVIGMSCRLPGAVGPSEFWALLSRSGSAITGVPAARRAIDPAIPPGHSGGFVDGIDLFDADFFGISPGEAAAMDPQQRLVLELGWEAVEDGRLSPGDLSGQPVGVFVGAMSADYAERVLRGGPASISRHTLAGLGRGIIANRVSHALGLTGPSLTVDAAQSSSLVAVHLACESLRRGETTLALAGGVNLNIFAESTLAVSAFGGLSPDYRCFTFDSRANGYVRGEGGGLVLLKPLHRARADGDRIYCVIRGGAVNNDGGAGALTVPDARAQEAVLRQAIDHAGVAAAAVDYVELHGTGTRVGDPVEARALGAVYGAARPDGVPLRVGSAKTNVGHLEGAAGIVGLLKTALSLHHGVVPASLNFDRPNPDIPLDELRLRVQRDPVDWVPGDRLAGVSSFGMGGTNCHLILGDVPPAPRVADPALADGQAGSIAGTGGVPWILSAHTEAALRDQAARLSTHVAAADLADVVHIGLSLATTRSSFAHRAVVIGDLPDLRDGLTVLRDGDASPDVIRGVVRAGSGTVLVLPGQVTDHAATVRSLRTRSAAFAGMLNTCVDALAPHLGWSPHDLLRAGTGEPHPDRPEVLASIHFAVLVAVAAFWGDLGVRPDTIIGEGDGGIAAAHLAGLLSLAEAAAIVTSPGAQPAVRRPEPAPAGPGRRTGRPACLLVGGAPGLGAGYGVIDLDTAVRTALADGPRAFVQVGLGTGLGGRIREILDKHDPERASTVVTTDGPHTDSTRQLIICLARLYAHGVAVDWTRVFPARARRVSLPTYPFQRSRHWLDTVDSTASGEDAAAAEPSPPPASPDADLVTLVRASVAAVLGHRGAGAVDVARSFDDLGLDSLGAVDLGRRLSAATGRRLPDTLTFDYPTPRALITHLAAQRAGREGTLVPGGATGPASGTAESPVPADPYAPHQTASDQVVIVAMAGRWPGGADTPERLWQLLVSGTDAIGEFPTNRGWNHERLYDPVPGLLGRSYVDKGGFLYDADEFDPEPFGISPREAAAMDPQQRLLLEVAWETIERSGLDPGGLRGSRTGVFIGLTSHDYGPRLHEADGSAQGYALTGTTTSVASGRLAYALGLEGPAVTVDTACSSSLVALHLAAAAVRSGECDLAVAGGAAVMATPGMFTEFSQQRGLAPDGRCKPFAAGADGTAWAEGVGLVLVERRRDAERHGHQILAVVRGSAVNSDGASNGLTAPNGPAQQRVIRATLDAAGLRPSDVDALEAHGTGTTLGDPIEAQAVLATYGQDRPADHPLWIGSVKSNIGHTQAAAGVTGVITMVLAMYHALLPRTLHLDEPSPRIDWTAGAVRPLSTNAAWPVVDRPRRGAVSSFGISGTNAHVILEQAPPVAPAAVTPRAGTILPWVLSAATGAALRAQAIRLDAAVHRGLDPADVAYSLATTRATLGSRAVIVAGQRDEFSAGLTALGEARAAAGLVVGEATPRRTAFVFSGQGSQRPGMGRELYETYPVFAAAFDAAAKELDAHLGPGVSIREVVFAAAPDGASLDRTVYTQAGLFALEVALFRLLASAGVGAELVAGHSIGELAAAHVAGVLSLADAATLVAARGRLMQSLPEGGVMVAIGAGEERVTELLVGVDGAGIAAVNGRSAVVISGDERPVLAVAERASAAGHPVKRLRVSHAFHSHHMRPILAEFHAVAASLTYAAPVIPVVSTVYGRLATAAELTSADYWVDQIRRPVRFADAMTWMRQEGVTAVLELGPDTVLTALAREAYEDESDQPEPVLVPLLRRDRPEPSSLLWALGQAYVHGVGVDWASLVTGTRDLAEHPPRRVALPTYAFQRRRYWLDAPSGGGEPKGSTVDEGFWEAVAGADLPGLATTLGIADDADRAALGAVLPRLASWWERQRKQGVVDSWRLRVGWEPVTDLAVVPPGRWLVAVAEDADAALAGRLTDLGVAVTEVRCGADRGTLARQLADLVHPETPDAHWAGDPTASPVTGVLSLLSLARPVAQPAAEPEAQAVPDLLPAGLAANLALIQALGDAGVAAPLWLVTQGAVSTGPADPVVDPAQALVWGLAGVVAVEHAERWGGIIDVPDRDDALGRLVAVLGGGHGENELAIRDVATSGEVAGRRVTVLARRLAPAPAAGAPVRAWRPHGTTLITGGTGALGARVARWLAGQGADHLLLASRRGDGAPGARELARELEELGTAVTLASVDVADRDSLSALLGRIPSDRPLTGVFHTAAVLDDALVASVTTRQLVDVLRVKVGGAINLDELTRGNDLSAFVLFSSVAGTVGNIGQATYAAGNAFLDALANRRRSAGLPATSIGWGHWAGGGIAAPEVEQQLRRQGLHAMAPELAIGALARVLDHDESNLIVAAASWPTVYSAHPRPLLARLAQVDGAAPEATPASAGRGDGRPAGPPPDLLRRLAELSEVAQRRLLLGIVRGQAALVQGKSSPQAVDALRGFRDQGFDSLAAVEFRNRLGSEIGLRLPASLVFDYPTPTVLAEHLRIRLVPPTQAAVPARPADSVASSLANASDDELIDFISKELGIS